MKEIDGVGVIPELEVTADGGGLNEQAFELLNDKKARQIASRQAAQKMLDKLPTTGTDAEFDTLYEAARIGLRGAGMSSRAPRYAKIVARPKTGRVRVETFLKAVIAFSLATEKVIDDLMPFTRVSA